MKVIRNARAVWRAIVELPRLMENVEARLAHLREAELRLAEAIRVRTEVTFDQPGNDRLGVRMEIGMQELAYCGRLNLWEVVGYRLARDMEREYHKAMAEQHRGPVGRLP
jgi:hypothetical protein